MSSPLTQALQDIDRWIETSSSYQARRIREQEFIRPGLEREMIELYAQEFEFHFSEEVYELYQWHDGGIEMGDWANSIHFTSLDRAVTNIVRGDFPYLPYLPLFVGDEIY